MAAPSWADVIAIAPGDAAAFTAMPGPSQTAFMLYASQRLNPSVWGKYYNQGVVYLAAHLAKLGLLQGHGAVTAEGVGPLTRQYGTPSGLKGSLALTSYGAEYYRLTRLLPTVLGAVF